MNDASPCFKKLQKAFSITCFFLLTILVLSLLTLIIIISVLCFKTYDAANIPDSLKNITTTLTSIVASLSLIATSINIKVTSARQKKAQQIQVFNRWYKVLVIDRHLTQLKHFFETCEGIIETATKLNEDRADLSGSAYDNRIQEDIIAPFTKAYTEVNEPLLSDSRIISTSLSKRLADQFSAMQDSFTKQLDSKEIDTTKITHIIRHEYAQIMSILMNYDITSSQP